MTTDAGNDDARFGGVGFGEPMTPFGRRFLGSMHFVTRRLFGLYFRSEVRYAERLPTSGPVILAPSHRSNIDTPLLGAAFTRKLRFMAKDSLFKSPFWTKFLVNLGGFPVKRGTLDRAALKHALAILERGEVLVVFPEGARQEGPRIKPVFEGALWLAAKAGAPVVPVGIGGTQQVMPIGVRIPRPKAVKFVLGEPLAVAHEDGSRVKRAELDALAASFRETLQDVFDEAQQWAGSPNEAWSPDDPGIDERIETWS